MLKLFKEILMTRKHKIAMDEKMMDPKSINQFFKGPRYNNTLAQLGNQKTRKLKRELDKGEKEIRALEEKIRQNHQKKDQHINNIMELSHEINAQEKEVRTKDLDREKSEIEKCKEEIRYLNEKLEKQHLDIKDMQKKLYKKMAEESYARFLHQQQKLVKVNRSIEGLRRKLNGLREEKEGIETELGQLYQMLHGVLGHEQMEQMDLAFLKNLEEKEASKHDTGHRN